MDVRTWFYDNTDTLYKNYHMSDWLKGLIAALFCATFAFIAYKIAEKHFHDPDYEENIEQIK